jgi:hypothetical protein
MALPQQLDSKFLESNFLIMWNEDLCREQKEYLAGLLRLPELHDREHQKTYTVLVAQHMAVTTYIMAMEETWEKEKKKKKNV